MLGLKAPQRATGIGGMEHTATAQDEIGGLDQRCAALPFTSFSFFSSGKTLESPSRDDLIEALFETRKAWSPPDLATESSV